MPVIKAFSIGDKVVVRLPDCSAGKQIAIIETNGLGEARFSQAAAQDNLRTAKAEFELWRDVIETGIFEGAFNSTSTGPLMPADSSSKEVVAAVLGGGQILHSPDRQVTAKPRRSPKKDKRCPFCQRGRKLFTPQGLAGHIRFRHPEQAGKSQ